MPMQALVLQARRNQAVSEGWTWVPMTITTTTGNIIGVQYGTPDIGWPPDDDGLAGVREPRRPDGTPPCLVAAREPDGSWFVPLSSDAL
jgi:hypothetical protein